MMRAHTWRKSTVLQSGAERAIYCSSSIWQTKELIVDFRRKEAKTPLSTSLELWWSRWRGIGFLELPSHLGHRTSSLWLKKLVTPHTEIQYIYQNVYMTSGVITESQRCFYTIQSKIEWERNSLSKFRIDRSITEADSDFKIHNFYIILWYINGSFHNEKLRQVIIKDRIKDYQKKQYLIYICICCCKATVIIAQLA